MCRLIVVNAKLSGSSSYQDTVAACFGHGGLVLTSPAFAITDFLLLDSSIISTILFCSRRHGLLLRHHRYPTPKAAHGPKSRLPNVSRRHDSSRSRSRVPFITNIAHPLHLHKQTSRHYHLYSPRIVPALPIPRHYKTCKSLGTRAYKHGHHRFYSCD